MCLLVVGFALDPDRPLMVGANRDEMLARPAVALTVLRDAVPRILGGRDLRAGGTWLAVNEHGVVAGLTNRPSPGGPDPDRRSRGEIPLALARHPSAESAAGALLEELDASAYNPCWILLGDRDRLYSIEIDGEGPASTVPLDPGLHVLENRPLRPPSPKSEWVRRGVAEAAAANGDLMAALAQVLTDHRIPPDAPLPDPSADGPVADGPRADRPVTDEIATEQPRPVETWAACVHTEEYGTRSSMLVAVSGDKDRRPSLWVADGPPCTAAFRPGDGLWEAPRVAVAASAAGVPETGGRA
jgi:uncharacterized protein with NRDE domain